MTLQEFLKSHEYLPPFLRDFHDQKDIFKCCGSTDETNWVQGSIYVMDRFLWFMAKHGYVLQKSRAEVPFVSLKETVATLHEKELEVLGHILNHQGDRK
jgi:hypothetical protein